MVAPYASSESGDTHLGGGVGGPGVRACVLLRVAAARRQQRAAEKGLCVCSPPLPPAPATS